MRAVIAAAAADNKAVKGRLLCVLSLQLLSWLSEPIYTDEVQCSDYRHVCMCHAHTEF